MAPARDDAEAYFRALGPISDGLLRELEEEARSQSIPIVGPVAGRLLSLLCRAVGARKVLELGAATGYSAIHLSSALPEGGRLTSVEMDPTMAAAARKNLARAGLSARTEVLEGDACTIMQGLSGSFDLVFLDIDKGGYASALPGITRLVRPGGLLVADNTAFADAEDFNKLVHEGPDYLAVSLFSFLPGHRPEHDGITLALRL
ncbi:MAG: O-methyltransferase [Thermodesulfobacteriota bacterium]